MSPSDLAAWYAAIIATIVLAWDVIKWLKSGPQISIEAVSGWRSFNIPETEGKDLSIITVTNNGDRPTTITSWGMYWQPTDKSKNKLSFVVMSGLAGAGKVPSKLEPGDVWKGLMLENDEFKEMYKSGKLYVALGLSHSKKEFKVQIIKSEKDS